MKYETQDLTRQLEQRKAEYAVSSEPTPTKDLNRIQIHKVSNGFICYVGDYAKTEEYLVFETYVGVEQWVRDWAS